MRRFGIACMAGVLGLLAGCGSYESQVSRLKSFAGMGSIGSSKDVWLEKFNFGGEWEKTALIFGYADDYQACIDMVAAWKAKYPLDTYRCTLAN
jgi:hypothetical protein